MGKKSQTTTNQRQYSPIFCILMCNISMLFVCLILLATSCLQMKSGTSFDHTYLGSLFSSIRSKQEDLIQVLIAIETGIAAVAIALLTVTTKNWGDLKLSTLQGMRREAERQDIVFGLMWALSFASAAVSTLGVVTSLVKQYNATDCLLVSFVIFMALTVEVLPSLLRYEGVGDIKAYSRSLSTLISAVDFAESIGLRIKKLKHNDHDEVAASGKQLHLLFTSFWFILFSLTLILNHFSIDAAATTYVALVCVSALWVFLYYAIRYSASKERWDLTVLTFLELTLFIPTAVMITCFQWSRIYAKAATAPAASSPFLGFIGSVVLIISTFIFTIAFAFRRKTLWKIRAVRNAYASEVTSLLNDAKLARMSLKNVPKDLSPSGHPLHKWIESELNTPTQVKAALRLKEDWTIVEESTKESQVENSNKMEHKPVPQYLPYNTFVIIQQHSSNSNSSRWVTSTRQQHQGRARSRQNLRRK